MAAFLSVLIFSCYGAQVESSLMFLMAYTITFIPSTLLSVLCLCIHIHRATLFILLCVFARGKSYCVKQWITEMLDKRFHISKSHERRHYSYFYKSNKRVIKKEHFKYIWHCKPGRQHNGVAGGITSSQITGLGQKSVLGSGYILNGICIYIYGICQTNFHLFHLYNCLAEG